MKRLLLLLLTGLTFLSLSACGGDSPGGDLFREEGPLPQEKPAPRRPPQNTVRSFISDLDQPPRRLSKSKPDDEAESRFSRESPAMDDVEEANPFREDEAIQSPELSQPERKLSKKDTPPKTQPTKNENLEDVPPADESDEVQGSSPDGNSGEEEPPSEEINPNQ